MENSIISGDQLDGEKSPYLKIHRGILSRLSLARLVLNQDGKILVINRTLLDFLFQTGVGNQIAVNQEPEILFDSISRAEYFASHSFFDEPKLVDLSFFAKDETRVILEMSMTGVQVGGGIQFEFVGPLPSLAETEPEFRCGRIAKQTFYQDSLNALTNIERSAHICSWSVDLKTQKEIWSDEVYRLLQIDANRETINFDRLLKVLTPRDRRRLLQARKICIQSKNSSELDFQILVGAELKHIRCVIEAVGGFSGETQLISGILQDISNHKVTELELAAAKEKAEYANLAKSAFIANISHEIKTPVTAISGYCELLRDASPGNDDFKQYAEIISFNASHLLQMTSNLLDVTRIEADRLDINPTSADIQTTLNDVLVLVKFMAEKKKLRINYRSEGEVPEKIFVDHTLLKHIVSNLLTNALKFTDQGNVDLILSFDCPAKRLKVIVSDTGCGMSAKQIGTLFTRYERFNADFSQQKEGTGLGMSIAKKLTEVLGGELTVKSKLRVGTSFTLSLPVLTAQADANKGAKPTARVETLPNPRKLLSGKILLAEDTEDLQNLYKKILVKAGFNVTVAGNGKKCVKLALSSREKGSDYDLILMDTQMPDCDGFTATANLRREGWTGRIIAITAFPVGGDFGKKYIDSGYDGVISKSEGMQDLVRKIEGVLANKFLPDPFGTFH